MRRGLLVLMAFATSCLLGAAPAWSEPPTEWMPNGCIDYTATTYRSTAYEFEAVFKPMKCPQGVVASEVTVTRCDNLTGSCAEFLAAKDRCLARTPTCSVAAEGAHPNPEAAEYTLHIELRTRTVRYVQFSDSEMWCVGLPRVGLCPPLIGD